MPTSNPRVAIFGNRVPSLNLPELEHFTDLGSLLAAEAFDVVLLDMPAAYAGKVLRKLRTLAPYRYTLIFCCRDQDGWCEALGDGVCPVETSEIIRLWRVWRDRFRQFDHGSAPNVLKAGCFPGCGCARAPSCLPCAIRRCLSTIVIRCWTPWQTASRSTRSSGSA